MKQRALLIVGAGVVATIAVLLWGLTRSGDARNSSPPLPQPKVTTDVAVDAPPIASTGAVSAPAQPKLIAAPEPPPPPKPRVGSRMPRDGNITLSRPGGIRQAREYRNGKPHGRWTAWNADGTVRLTADFVDGVAIATDGTPIATALQARAATKLLSVFKLYAADPHTDNAGLEPPGSVREAIERLEPKLVTCVENTRDRAIVTIHIVIDETSRVSRATTNVDDAHRDLGACIVAALESAQFPEQAAGSTIDYPFVF